MKLQQLKSWVVLNVVGLSLATQALAAPTSVRLEPSDLRAARNLDSRLLDPKDQSVELKLNSISQKGPLVSVSGTFAGRAFVGQASLRKPSPLVDVTVELVEEDHGACGDFRREYAVIRIRRTTQGEPRVVRAELTVEATSDRCHDDGVKMSAVLIPANDEVCRQSLTDHIQFNMYTIDPETRQPLVGFSGVRGYGVWGEDLSASLVMKTQTSNFYYTLPCDICADVLKCDRDTGAITSVFSGHAADCSVIPEAERAGATYLNCQ